MLNGDDMYQSKIVVVDYNDDDGDDIIMTTIMTKTNQDEIMMWTSKFARVVWMSNIHHRIHGDTFRKNSLLKMRWAGVIEFLGIELVT
jgi:hypothetical protein